MTPTTLAPPLELRLDQVFAPRHTGLGETAVSDGGRLTLGQLVDSVWEGLHAAGAAGCPVCGSRMERRGARGECGGCGAGVE